MFNSERAQLRKNIDIFKAINSYEENFDPSRRTIIAGDMNLNTFESNLSGPHALNARNNCSVIAYLSNIKLDKLKDYWYNPMWNLLGDVNLCQDYFHA